MSLPHALLLALIEKPSTGFDLAKRFDRSMGYYWQATHQQIYRELARLEQEQLIRSGDSEAGESSTSRSRKKIYHILPAGEETLRQWALLPSEPMPLREELMVKLRVDAIIGPLGMQPPLAARRAIHEERLKKYQALEQQYFHDPAMPRSLQIEHKILKAGIQYEQAGLDWIDEVAALLANLDSTVS